MPEDDSSSLYSEGWRRGSAFAGTLPLRYVVLKDGSPYPVEVDHPEWVVVAQDCDLVRLPSDGADRLVEVRPLYREDPPADQGIRSRRFLIDGGRYLDADAPRTFVTPELLSTFSPNREADLSDDNLRALTKWLGLRYDRPAVPQEVEALAKAISHEVARKKRKETAGLVRDVLMQFDPHHKVPRYSLFAIIEKEEDIEIVREWLTDISRAVSPELGIADEIEAATAEGTSLHLIETSYAADATQVTWSTGSPKGAY